MGLTLDRLALDDVGANPTRIAAAIHQQLGGETGPIAVFEVAVALDIVEIRIEELKNFEGALITTPERSVGVILVNKRSSRQRQRFTASHELLHFLSPVHRPTSADGFWCSRDDMIANQLDSKDRHLRQGAEANAFAIELLAPLKRIKRYIHNKPDLAAVLAMSDDLDISKQAAARRYVSRHQETLAVVFSRDGYLLYFDRSRHFPWLSLRKNAAMPTLPQAKSDTGVSEVEEADPDDWIANPDHVVVTVQTLRQQAGHAMTLLHLVSANDDDGGIDDAYERFSRFSD